MPSDEPILVFYDGRCSVCVRSANYFRKHDRDRGLVRCIDFRADPEAAALADRPIEQLSASLHARLPNGTVQSGPEAIRTIMDALGRGWQARWTRWPIIRPIADRCYNVFARNRLRFFEIKHECDDSCAVPHRSDHTD